ncbi:MAG: thiamine pyrophosphate-dependent enzyme, partial [Amphiplicatus sp.]
VDDVREHNDPIKRCEQRILDGGFADETALKKIDAEIKAVVKEAAEFSLESPEPAPEELFTDILA